MPVDLQTPNSNVPQTAYPLKIGDGRYTNAAYIFMGLLAVYVLVRGVAGAAARPFWIDELCTLGVASEAGVQGIWGALKRGLDGNPPLFYLIERLALKVSGNREIALRLPSIVAFPCLLMCVFAYARKRGGDVIACVCAFLLLSTSLFQTYQLDARPYGLMIACMAFALVCYQRLPSIRWTVLLGLSLLLAESLHYYAVLAMIPIGLAEAVLFLRTRRLRWTVWAALTCGLLPVAVSWPLIRAEQGFLGAHSFSRPVFRAVPGYYGTFFLLSDRVLGMALALVAVATTVWYLLSAHEKDLRHVGKEQCDVSEGMLVLSLIALPYIGFVVARVTQGSFLSRYVMMAIIGVVLGLGYALSIAGRKATAIFAIFAFCVVGMREYSFWRIRHNPVIAELTVVSKENLAEIQELIESGGHLDLPVVFDQEVVYPQMVYYRPLHWTRRLVFLTDEEREFSNEENDTGVRINKALSNFYPLRLQDYSEFTAKHSNFLLYAEPEGWILKALRHEGVSAEALKCAGFRCLYVVKMNNSVAPDTPAKTILPGSMPR